MEIEIFFSVKVFCLFDFYENEAKDDKRKFESGLIYVQGLNFVKVLKKLAQSFATCFFYIQAK